jgi:hypothetical protein
MPVALGLAVGMRLAVMGEGGKVNPWGVVGLKDADAPAVVLPRLNIAGGHYLGSQPRTSAVVRDLLAETAFLIFLDESLTDKQAEEVLKAVGHTSTGGHVRAALALVRSEFNAGRSGFREVDGKIQERLRQALYAVRRDLGLGDGEGLGDRESGPQSQRSENFDEISTLARFLISVHPDLAITAARGALILAGYAITLAEASVIIPYFRGQLSAGQMDFLEVGQEVRERLEEGLRSYRANPSQVNRDVIPDEEIEARARSYIRDNPGRSCNMFYNSLKSEGVAVNRNRVYSAGYKIEG